MKFGQSAEEAENDTRGSGGSWIKYMKDGDTTFRILQQPSDWVYFWEHFNPGGFSFPCTNERDTCPGCTSDIEKMKKAGRKIAFNVLEGEYVNVYKVPSTLADKLKLRYDRLDTITDREYTITRYKTAGDRTEYDLEGGDKSPVDVSKYELRDIESMLSEAYDEAWGDSNKAKSSLTKAKDAEADEALRDRMAKAEAEQEEKPPF